MRIYVQAVYHVCQQQMQSIKWPVEGTRNNATQEGKGRPIKLIYIKNEVQQGASH